MNRRARIAMSHAEIENFLGQERVVTCATLGPDGWPHLMPLWYVLRAGRVWAWTYGRSQKVRNLERDPRATLQVEAGARYDELRGVMLRTRVRLHRDAEEVARLGAEVSARYAPGDADPAELVDLVRDQAVKRVGLEFVPEAAPATWDHRKLAAAAA
jgi:PPOX class probable F420-dependent enzyme